MTPIRIDPDDNELHNILRYAHIEGRRVLDIGCGEGDLTCQYAESTSSVIGVDPDLSDLHIALEERPETLSQSVQFLAARAESLPFSNHSFDIVLFTSSL